MTTFHASKRNTVAWLAAGFLAVGLVAGISNKLLDASAQVEPAPTARPSVAPGKPTYGSLEEERAAEQKAARATDPQESTFLAQFKASGRDVHELPRGGGISAAVASFGPELSDAVRKSAGVVRARVGGQTVADGYVESRLSVTSWLAGGDGSSEIRLQQTGGLVWNGGTPGLSELSNDPILWKGREYIIVLTRCFPVLQEKAIQEGFYCSSIWGRQFEILPDGKLRAGFEEEPWTHDADGKLAAEFEAEVVAAK